MLGCFFDAGQIYSMFQMQGNFIHIMRAEDKRVTSVNKVKIQKKKEIEQSFLLQDLSYGQGVMYNT